MVETSCHCSLVRISVQRAPSELTDCNCSICRRYGVLWAYYSLGEVTIQSGAPLETYLWGERKIAFNRCPSCGCVSHWSSVDPARDRMGVNARLMPLEIVSAARIRHLDGAKTERYVD